MHIHKFQNFDINCTYFFFTFLLRKIGLMNLMRKGLKKLKVTLTRHLLNDVLKSCLLIC